MPSSLVAIDTAQVPANEPPRPPASVLIQGLRGSDIEQNFNTLAEIAQMRGRPLDADLVRDVVRERDNLMLVEIGTVKKVVAEHYKVTVEQIGSRRRFRSVTHPRMVAAYLCRELTGASFPELGEQFDRDHSTIIHACKKIGALVAEDQGARAEIEGLRERVLSLSQVTH